jgi:peptidoglycan/xylan/chitin deacetylase (PgdA/CDA1 family)
VLILAYHRVVADIALAERESIYGLVISAETFERHMQIVRENCDVLTLDEAAEVLRGERTVKHTAAVVTFDDGYRDVYEHAWPVLRRYAMPATVYVPTALIGGTQLLDHDRLFWLVLRAREQGIDLRWALGRAGFSPERAARICDSPSAQRLADALNFQPTAMRERVLQTLEEELSGVAGPPPRGFNLLTWEMVREMACGGVTFGAHTERHPILTLEPEEAAMREIRRSRETLQTRLGVEVRHFAYPCGHYHAGVRQLVAEAGFATAVTTERRVNQVGCDPLELGRISLCEESTRGISGGFSEAVARLRLAA